MAHCGDPTETVVTALKSRVPQLAHRASLYINRTTVLYGPSGSGKTVYTRFIMKLLSPHFDQALIVSPTEASNRSYTGTLPPQLIHYRCGFDGALSDKGLPLEGKEAVRHFLDEIIYRQKIASEIHAKVNDTPTLRRLYARARTPRGDRLLEAVAKARRVKLTEATRSLPSPEAVEIAREKIGNDFGKIEARVYKNLVLSQRTALRRLKGLSDDDAFVLQYLAINHHLLLVFDDCAAELKPFFKTEQFRKLFYQGRHLGVTMIMCCQDDTDVDPNLRKNVFLSIYMTPQIAATAFRRAAANAQEQKYVSDIVPEVYAREHRKLVFIRDDPQRYYHTTVPLTPPFRFGSEAMWRLCATVAATKSNIDVSNPYYERFRLKPAEGGRPK